MLTRLPYNPTPSDDDWESITGDAWWQTWGLGFVLAIVVAAVGVRTVWTQRVDFDWDMSSEHLAGAPAVAIGIEQFGIALLLCSQCRPQAT